MILVRLLNEVVVVNVGGIKIRGMLEIGDCVFVGRVVGASKLFRSCGRELELVGVCVGREDGGIKSDILAM